LKVEDIDKFNGKDMEHYIRSLEIISDIYGERMMIPVLPRCMRGVARAVGREWLISIPPEDPRTKGLCRGGFILSGGFGEDPRGGRERAEARDFRPWKEMVEEYSYGKAAMHRRAEPFMTEIEVMREVWKGLSPNVVDLMVVSRKQYNKKEF